MHNSKTCHIMEVNSLQHYFMMTLKVSVFITCIDSGCTSIKIILICRNFTGNKMT